MDTLLVNLGHLITVHLTPEEVKLVGCAIVATSRPHGGVAALQHGAGEGADPRREGTDGGGAKVLPTPWFHGKLDAGVDPFSPVTSTGVALALVEPLPSWP